ncbi:hypothetical protein V6N13_141054 [Hibiscus sabdariffa]
MEKLKCLVPESLKRRVAESSIDHLPSLSSSLLQYFLSLPQFHQMISELAAEPSTQAGLCAKNKGAALELKQKGNQCYSSGDHSQALRCYSQALRLAPIDAHDTGKNLVATLYLNRASLFHKMGLPMESLRDCSRALEISPSYPKVWYRRGKVNATLGNYEDAVHDLTVAKNMETSIGGKKQIESELEILAQHHENKSAKPVHHSRKSVRIPDVPQQIKLQCVETADKGRGMISQVDIPEASLIHTEEPYAVVILKQYRETHCHYCLNELPADTIPCVSCSLPLYCSQHCQMQAGGQIHVNYSSKINIHKKKSNRSEECPDINGGNNCDPKLDHIPEHKHECQGVHWPAILPSDVVLAGRVLVKSMEQKGQFTDVPNLSEILIVILLSQIRVNSMAIVRMKSNDFPEQQNWFQKFSSGEADVASSLEQVRVGQALYRAASLFNHSCKPNIHAYYISRSLLLRTTEFVAEGCPLELSYGPQVGQWDCKDRLRFLEEEYFFRCWCRGCSKVNASDLVISGFCCVNPNCSGVVLDNLVVNCEKKKLNIPETISNESQVHESGDIDVKKVAHISLDQTHSSLHIDPGYCLKCGSYCNFSSRSEEVKKAWIDLRRLQDSIASKDMCSTRLPDALRSLGLLRSTLHAYNKSIAEAEDIVAKAFCLIGDFQPARDHCKSSIEILEMLYGPNHIAVGNELVKLSSIQLAMGDSTAANHINRASEIFCQIPGTIGDLLNLEVLSFRENNLTGPVPSSIGNLTFLSSLDFSYNTLSGTIPFQIGNLQNLEGLFLRHNNFTGFIPPSIFNMSTARVIRLGSNQLSGQLPPITGSGLPKLEGLFLELNELSGPIPSSISNASKLIILQLLNNSFSGIVPDTFGNLKDLQRFDISHNNLSSEPELRFLSSLTNCKDLEVVIFDDNPLISGELPVSVGNLSASVTLFYASHCSIKGRIPREIGNLSQLFWLGLDYNGFTGTIPATLGNLRELQNVNLGSNKLQGSIPSELCRLQRLTYLTLTDNELSGPIPACLGDVVSLRNLFLGLNKFTSIPSTLTRLNGLLFLELSSNSLTGSLPVDIGNWKSVTNLNLSENRFSGAIPSSIAGLMHLTHLSLSGNMLQGSVPQSFGDFGIAKLLGEEDSMAQTKTLATIGYMSPEYGSEGIVSTKGDVYSFGILVMETFTGKKPTDDMFAGDASLKCWVKESLPYAADHVVDPNFLNTGEREGSAVMDCVSSILPISPGMFGRLSRGED